MINLIPREYQTSITETAKLGNTLVVLPTGIGKTLIALMLSIERLKSYPGSKVLVLAPTKPLVEQHFDSFKKELPELFADLQLFTGAVPSNKRKKIFQTAEVIFSTPQCIANDLRKGLYDLKEASLVVIDEAHRCLNNYDYTAVMDYYKRQGENQRILGLTASPGSDADKVRQICRHLDISSIEVRTRDSEDVKPYLKELEFNKLEIEFPKDFAEIRVLLKRIWDSCVGKLRERNFLFGPANKITLLKLQNNLSRQISSGSMAAMAGISVTAQAIKISHALELLETQTLSGLKDYMNGMMQQAEENKSRAVKMLVKMPEFNAAFLSLTQLLAKNREHPKIDRLAELIKEEFRENPKSKIIVFAQFRETAGSIARRLAGIEGVRASIFIGQAKTRGGEGFSQKEQKRVIEEFREGNLNVICATSIGEEGLDIPEVSAVVFYEPIPSAIRKIQRTGRTARLASGKLFILVTKDTKDEINHYASSARERKMYKTIELVQKEIKSKGKTLLDFK